MVWVEGRVPEWGTMEGGTHALSWGQTAFHANGFGLLPSGSGELSECFWQSNLIRFVHEKGDTGVGWRDCIGWIADEETGRTETGRQFSDIL